MRGRDRLKCRATSGLTRPVAGRRNGIVVSSESSGGRRDVRGRRDEC